MPDRTARDRVAIVMTAVDGHVYRVLLADPGGGFTTQEVPTAAFEATERGITLYGTTVVPWHRVVRYTRDVVQPLGEPDLSTHAEIRAWLDDGSPGGEHVRIRGDRFDPGPWTADFLVEDAVDVERATIHLRKLYVPWSRILEYERVHASAEDRIPIRPD
jgi:uncharacterized protein (UPF0248 family)